MPLPRLSGPLDWGILLVSSLSHTSNPFTTPVGPALKVFRQCDHLPSTLSLSYHHVFFLDYCSDTLIDLLAKSSVELVSTHARCSQGVAVLKSSCKENFQKME